MADEEEMVEVEVVEALFALTEAGDTELLARLLDENPEVLEEQHEDTGATPLISGAQHGHVGVVCLCLERGAMVEARDRMSLTALQHAAIGGHTEVALRLLRAGADADTWDTFFLTSPLLQAASRGHAGVMFALLPYLSPSALHRTDMSGHTALWLACSQGHAQAVLLLLQAGAQWLRASTAPRQTPREVAVANGHSLCAAIIDVSSQHTRIGRERKCLEWGREGGYQDGHRLT
jgi:ankyrin repeat protein